MNYIPGESNHFIATALFRMAKELPDSPGNINK